MRFIERLVAIHQEPRDLVIGRHLEAMQELDKRSVKLSTELREENWTTERLRIIMQDLGEIAVEDFERTLGPLKAARELVFFKGRFRLSLPSTTI